VRHRAIPWAAGLLLACALGGCGKFSRERYDTIYYTQWQSEVRRKLGRADRTLPDAWIYSRRRPIRCAAILFENGRVAGKIWSDIEPIDEEAIEKYRRGLAGKP